ncbi:MAG: DNA recombination protein RmuC [Desulfitobacterium hafniense]|nr:DNA recombination protein RmuC [Desulfitobacterium hafniense]
MIETLLAIIAGLSALNLILMIILLTKNSDSKYLKLENRFSSLERAIERNERLVNEQIAINREEASNNARQSREELGNTLKSFNDSLLTRMTEIASLQKNQLDIFSVRLNTLTGSNEQRLDKLRETVEQRLKLLQEDNAQKLEQMRATVDEKLHATLEQRLGESFKLVSERLEMVHKGLGEMQSLATGVGDLKRVLTNVKARGTWGEIQLGNLLEQVLTVDQYSANVQTKNGSNDRVEFAIKIPARDGEDSWIWLPIDAKFPLEDYQRLVEAQEQVNLPMIEEAGKALEARIKSEAKYIRHKYIDPPNTTDFGILFLPIEGLYAEVLRRPGLCEALQRDYRVVITGPATIAAFLNSLQMGFRTLAIEKRSSEVWALLGAVKTEFVKFGDILEKTQKKLQEASNSIETAAKKSRTIERKLKNVEGLPVSESLNLIGQLEDNEYEAV